MVCIASNWSCSSLLIMRFLTIVSTVAVTILPWMDCNDIFHAALQYLPWKYVSRTGHYNNWQIDPWLLYYHIWYKDDVSGECLPVENSFRCTKCNSQAIEHQCTNWCWCRCLHVHKSTEVGWSDVIDCGCCSWKCSCWMR